MYEPTGYKQTDDTEWEQNENLKKIYNIRLHIPQIAKPQPVSLSSILIKLVSLCGTVKSCKFENMNSD